MSFQSIKQEATDWTIADGSYRLLDSIESEHKLVFVNNEDDSITFHIVSPSTSKPNEWSVWSDSDNVLVHLHHVIDYASCSQKKSIADILTKICASLLQLCGASGNDDDDDEGIGYGDDDDDDEYDDDDADYYAEQDIESTSDHLVSDCRSQFTEQGSSLATDRLIKDLKNFQASNGKFGVTGSPRGDNLYIWDVQLRDFPKDTPLGKDMQKYAKQYKREPVIDMELIFPKDYPMSPPFARVLKPRFKFLTGHITIGGSVCMEMLAKSGWRPTNEIESILIQIRAEIMSDAKTRLDSNPDRPYDEAEARNAFKRMVQKYGWDK